MQHDQHQYQNNKCVHQEQPTHNNSTYKIIGGPKVLAFKVQKLFCPQTANISPFSPLLKNTPPLTAGQKFAYNCVCIWNAYFMFF